MVWDHARRVIGRDREVDWRLPDEALREVLRSNWGLRDGRIKPLIGGATSDVWLVEAGGHWYVAKFAYDDTSRFELGLLAAEAVQREGLRCAAPVHILSGALSVELEGPPGRRHPLALFDRGPLAKRAAT